MRYQLHKPDSGGDISRTLIMLVALDLGPEQETLLLHSSWASLNTDSQRPFRRNGAS